MRNSDSAKDQNKEVLKEVKKLGRAINKLTKNVERHDEILTPIQEYSQIYISNDTNSLPSVARDLLAKLAMAANQTKRTDCSPQAGIKSPDNIDEGLLKRNVFSRNVQAKGSKFFMNIDPLHSTQFDGRQMGFVIPTTASTA